MIEINKTCKILLLSKAVLNYILEDLYINIVKENVDSSFTFTFPGDAIRSDPSVGIRWNLSAVLTGLSNWPHGLIC